MAVGIVQLEEAFKALALVANTAGKVYEDKELSVGDIPAVLEALPVLATFAAINYETLVAEAKDLDAEEAQELANLFKEQLKLPQADVQEMIEKGLQYVKVIMQSVEAIKEIIAIFKK